MKLQPLDMALHAAIAAAFTALGGWLLPVLTPWPFAAAAFIAFGVRESFQQMKKNNPPSAQWKVWEWGPRGLAEWLVTGPAVIAAAFLVSVM